MEGISQEQKERTILHVDMDSFFASVEIQRNPELRGKPVIVGADPKGGRGRGVVSTCSYEARKFGVRSGMPIARAYKLCPEAVYLPVNMSLYQEVSRRVMVIIRNFADKFEQTGIDEAYLDATEMVKRFGSAEELALSIKKSVFDKEGLTCSIGIGPNKSVAKIASDFKKPNGLTIVRGRDVKDFLAPIPVSKIVGVGKKSEEKLKEMGIETIGQLASYPRENLEKALGSYGLWFWKIANGLDEEEVREGEGEPQSLSLEHTFEKDVKDVELISKTIDSMAEELGMELNRQGLLFKTISIKIRFQDFQTFTRSKSLVTPSDDKETMSRIAKILLREFEEDRRKVRLIGLKVSNFKRAREKQEPLTRWL